MKPYYEDAASGIVIYHGETLEVLPQLGPVQAVITDPPYSSGGMIRGDRMRSTTSKYVQTGTMATRPDFTGDNRDQRGYLAWSSLWMCAAKAISDPGSPIAVFTDWRQLPTTTDAIQCGGWVWRGIAVWSKAYGRVNSAGFSAAAEYLVWGTNGPAEEREDYPAGVIECQAPRNRQHIAEKPIDVMRWALRIVQPGGTVLDPFMGGGTTLVAAKLEGRKAIGIEFDERHCETAVRRLAQGALDFTAPAREPALLDFTAHGGA